jgi:hypothetical protein
MDETAKTLRCFVKLERVKTVVTEDPEGTAPMVGKAAPEARFG